MVPTIANKFAKRLEEDMFPRMLCWTTKKWNEKASHPYSAIEQFFVGEQVIVTSYF